MKESTLEFDPNLPAKLKKTQQWFGSIIERAIDKENHINPLSPSGNPIQNEAALFIRPSPTLAPYRRIEIYNQQYWWRLLAILQDIYPVVTRLFGYFDFNQTIAIPYLLKYPPNHWSLNVLGSHLPKWIEEEYHAADRPLVLNCAQLDCAFNHAFLTEQLNPLTFAQVPEGNPSTILDKPLQLQPHIHLFELPYNLFQFRDKMIKESVDFWIDNDFPKLAKNPEYFILYRNLRNDISWEIISRGEYSLLSLFKKGASIEEACEFLEKEDSQIAKETSFELATWFQKWVIGGWLVLR